MLGLILPVRGKPPCGGFFDAFWGSAGESKKMVSEQVYTP